MMLLTEHKNISDFKLRKQIKGAILRFGGNSRLKIYGRLNCRSGKRMKRENRVFFASELEAVQNGYRPCGHCMKTAYIRWKNGLV